MKQLTIKQRKFIKEYLKTGNGTKAVQAAGYKCKNPAAYSEMAWAILRKLEGKMCQVLTEAGLDNATLAKKAEEGLNAMVVKPFAEHGVVVSEPVYIDYPTRAKYLEIVSKMKGLLKEKSETKVSGVVTFRIKGRDEINPTTK